jgi:hypothetical protein
MFIAAAYRFPQYTVKVFPKARHVEFSSALGIPSSLRSIHPQILSINHSARQSRRIGA